MSGQIALLFLYLIIAILCIAEQAMEDGSSRAEFFAGAGIVSIVISTISNVLGSIP
jgi:hypothetical protein